MINYTYNDKCGQYTRIKIGYCRVRMLQKQEKKNTVYFTENHPNAGVDDSLWGYKYFLLYKNTFGTFRKYRTQEEAIDDMKKILKEE